VTGERRIEVHEDPAVAAGGRLAAAAGRGGHLVLAGGSTPRAAYEAAAASGVPWNRVTLWLGDERCVPPDDERANARMVREALLDRLPAPPRLEAPRCAPDLEAGADAYERALRVAFDGGPPRFELVLLGIGPDAHVASLFPGAPALDERERLAVGVREAGMEPFVPRVTLTLSALSASREVVVLVAGEGKAEAVARAFGGDDPGPGAPASLVRPEGTLTVMCDRAAAGRLAGAARG
jgi:6-phosphogluconolactonase